MLQGEAYFIVRHEDKRPFRVETGNLVVTALGTEFNVMAYPGQLVEETALVEGSVIVERTFPGQKPKVLRTMEPGQHLSINLHLNQHKAVEDDLRKYVAWKDGMLVFRHDRLEDITTRLGRWYNVDFEFTESSIKDYPFTATFVDETLPQIMELLKMAIPISYKITPRVKQADGTFSKPRVIISSKRR